MDFSLSPEQSSIQDEMLRLGGSLDDDLRARERCSEFSPASWQRCGEARVAGLPIPDDEGGRGLDIITTAIALEAFATACSDEGLAFSLCTQMQCCALPIHRFGTAEQKRRYLPPLCSGQSIGANAASEPEAGSDVFSMRTTAVRDGGDWVLNGSKCFVTNGPIADVLVVYAVTDERHRQYGGISAFLVDASSPGVEIGDPQGKIGLRTAPWCDLRLDECRLPAESLLGDAGAGAAIFAAAMQWERLLIPAIALGRMEATLQRTLRHARTRKQFGQSIGKHQSVAKRLVEMKRDLDCSRLLLYRAAWLQTRGEKALLETSLSKLVTTERRLHFALNAIQIHGARGCRESEEIERELRNAVPGTISSGTSEVQEMIIARCLGL